MIDLSHADNQIQSVTNFKDLVSTTFQGQLNALYWHREINGDFSEIVKKIWVYIKGNNLQDAKDKRMINCDAKLKPIFGDKVHMMKMAGFISKHIS